MIDAQKWVHHGYVLDVEFPNRLHGKEQGGNGNIKDNDLDL